MPGGNQQPWPAPADRSFRMPPTVISFSGMDGSGKSTSIANLIADLQALGLRVKTFTYWDNVVVFPRFRVKVTSSLLHGETGIGSAEKPVQRRDKNFRPWYASLGRSLLYLLDTAHLRVLTGRLGPDEADVVVFDRYLYDQLATLPVEGWIGATYARTLAKLATKPRAAFLLDAEPEIAFRRKPEYPVEFLRQYRAAYLRVSELFDEVTVLPPMSPDETRSAILRSLVKRGVIPSQDAVEETARA